MWPAMGLVAVNVQVSLPGVGIGPVAVQLRIVTVQLNFGRKSDASDRVFTSSRIIAAVVYANVMKSVIVGQRTAIDDDALVEVGVIEVHLQQHAAPGVLHAAVDLVAILAPTEREY